MPELSEDYAAEARFDKSFQTVQEAETHTDAELFQAISDLSGHGLQRSKFYREQTELIEQAVPYCFRQMCDYFRNRKKSDYLEYLFGKKGLLPYHMFNYATFFETDPERNCDYVLSPYHIYRCRSGKWTCEAYFDAEKGKKRLGCFVKTIDQKLRQLVQYPHPIKETELPKYLQQVLDKTLAAFLDERKRMPFRKWNSTCPVWQGSGRRQRSHGTSCWWTPRKNRNCKLLQSLLRNCRFRKQHRQNRLHRKHLPQIHGSAKPNGRSCTVCWNTSPMQTCSGKAAVMLSVW